jgi:hypothetical protein
VPSPTPLDTRDPAVQNAPTAGPPSATAPRDQTTEGRRRPSRVAVGVLAAALVLGGGAAVQQIRTADAAATAAEQRTARADLASDVGTIREGVAAPARDGGSAATGLLRHQLLVLAGEAPDATVGERLTAQMRDAADRLDEAATAPMPDRPSVLPVATVDPVFDRLSGLEDQATDLAVVLRSAADDATAWLDAVRDLDDAAVTYAETTDQLPSGSDPGAIAAAWEADGALLDAYAEAIDRAEGHEASAPLAEAHLELVEGMQELADEALARLRAGDVDGYNAVLADRLGPDDPFGFGTALEDARAEVADAAIAGPLEDARARALGLLTEVEELRRATPAQLAAVS